MPDTAAARFPAPFRSSEMQVEDDWIDYNGHMNVAYYMVLFDRTIDQSFHPLGLGPDYVAARNASFFTVEAHIHYIRELQHADPVVATLQLLAYDAKRIHVYQELFHAEDGFRAAACEQLFLHVDMATKKTAPFPPDILANLAAMQRAHAGLPVDARVGRVMGIPAPIRGD